jgi:hypothetical protein
MSPVAGFDLTSREAARLSAMASDPRMSVLCSLYRSNRLTALVRTVPTVVDALGVRLSTTVSLFWVEHQRTDMQFRSEAREFCDFVRNRYPQDQQLRNTVEQARRVLV